MDGFWHWLLAWLCFWSADPAIIEAEQARAAGLANVAYAAMAREEPPAPERRRIDLGANADTPLFDAHRKKCSQCSKPLMNPDGTENSICQDGFALWQQDVRNAVEKPRPKVETTPCRDGKCPPGASLAPVLPSVPAGRR